MEMDEMIGKDIREYARDRRKFNALTPDQKIFVAKRIEKDVKKIAKRNGISEETAYEFYVKGCFI